MSWIIRRTKEIWESEHVTGWLFVFLMFCVFVLCVCVSWKAKKSGGSRTRPRKIVVWKRGKEKKNYFPSELFVNMYEIYLNFGRLISFISRVWMNDRMCDIVSSESKSFDGTPFNGGCKAKSFGFFLSFFLLLPLNLVVLEPSSVRFAISVCWFMCRCVCLRFFLGMTVVVVAVYLDFREWKIDTHVTRDGTDLLVSNGCYT